MSDNNRIEKKLDSIESKLSDIDKTLVRQEENLKEHMRRTELNEIAVEKLSLALEPVRTHVSQVEGVAKFLGVFAVLVSIVAGIISLFK